MKRKLDAIFKAFEGYIRGQDYFDIVYSEKFGYVRISINDDEIMKLLDSPEEMLDSLFYDIISEVVYSPGNPHKEHDDFTLTEYEETESRRRIAAILETMDEEDKARYFDLLDACLKAYQQGGILEPDDQGGFE